MGSNSKKASQASGEHVRVQSQPIKKFLQKSAVEELAKPPEFPRLVSSGK
ncbi:MAG: hypothetical protein QOE68_4417 [Thermoanaerobaculia bacterium]|jgi:hypothetical protein|nr:hypothetical protein [Thermoanaerobaculia bacterium]